MKTQRIYAPLIVLILVLFIYQTYNIYAENEATDAVTKNAEDDTGKEPHVPSAEGTVSLPQTGEEVPARPAEGTLPLSQTEKPVLVRPAEETVPIPPAEATIPLPPIEVTLPVLPKEKVFMEPTPVERKREKVGSESCRTCHEEQLKKWNDTIHAKWHPSFIEPDKAKESKIECETCHGSGSLHLEDNRNHEIHYSQYPP